MPKQETKAVLVVGGAGYLGSVLVEELVGRGYAVTVFDRLFFDQHGLRNVRDRIELYAGDMRRMDAAALENIGAVINLGGLSNDPTAEYNPEANYQMNTVAAEILAATSKAQRIPRYIGITGTIFEMPEQPLSKFIAAAGGRQ